MLRFDFKNLHKVSKKHGLTLKEIRARAKSIPAFLKKIEARDQDFYKVIDDEGVLEEIEQFVAGVNGKFSDVVVLGIGGSALGTLCLQQSLTHLFENELPRGFVPKLHVLDNIDPSLIQQIEDVIDLKKTLFIVISKSGGTPETLAQYFYFKKRLESAGRPEKKHFVFITDPQRGLLRRIAQEKNIPCFAVPPKVGGRFSVLTAVGLLPAALIGIDIRLLIEGAQRMRDRFLSQKFEENFPFQLAAVQFLLNKKGKTMNVILPYSHRLIRFADWYRQLLAESCGKKLNDRGKVVNTGITPINALGVTDQHSQSQLYNEGPNDKFFIFIEVEKLGPTIPIPNPFPNDPDVGYLKKVTFNRLMQTELEGTRSAYTKNDRPNMTVTISQVDESHLGELFMLFEAAIAFLGEFYGINAFDQPGVELSKTLTKKLLIKT